jgi:secreted trypsin-like serine protease
MDKVMIVRVILMFCFCAICQVHGKLTEIDRNMRIVGGTTARVAQFPHAVALVLHLTLQRSSFCGGSIIHPSYVLTVSVNFSEYTIKSNFITKTIHDKNKYCRSLSRCGTINSSENNSRDIKHTN